MFLNGISFSSLFSDKHGVEEYNIITSQIQKEKNKIDNNYIETIFKIAFFKYFGLEDNALQNMLNDIGCKITISELKNTHKNSIEMIIDQIKSVSNEEITDN